MRTIHSKRRWSLNRGFGFFFALPVFLLACSVAMAQDRHELHRRDGGYHTSHWVYDDRYHHGHFYPAIGYSVTILPTGYTSVTFSGRRFFFHWGVWYQPAGPGFVVVRPPVGVVVPVLPPAYTPVWVAGVPYYYANDVYYRGAAGGYVVSAPPPGAELPPGAPPPPAGVPPVAQTVPAPAPAAPPAPAMWYYCESAKAYYPYVAECKEGWREVPATPPPPH